MPKEKDPEEDNISEEEIEEDFSEDEESDDGVSKKRKKPRNMFLDVEAEVDEEDDEEEPEDEAELLKEDFIIDDKSDEELDDQYENRIRIARRVHQDDFNPEEEEKRLRELYGRHDYHAVEKVNRKVPKQFLLPSVSDPKLWLVKCKVGREAELMLNLTRKCLSMEYSGSPLMIKSIIAREDLKGYIYIEAFKQAHVMQAIEKVNGIYGISVSLVPTKEMVDVMTINTANVTLSPGQWVRMKRGKYAGDLAQIVSDVVGDNMVTVKLIPRLDIYSIKSEDETKRKKNANRPPQKLFNPQEVSKLDRSGVAKNRGYWVYKGENFKDGFLEKDVKLITLDTQNVSPTLEEISHFVGTEQDLQNLTLSHLKSDSTFEIGDTVEVIDGDLINLMGTVESISDEVVKVKPTLSDFKDLLTFKVSQLKKFFKIGDHVSVINGQHQGESGLIVKVEDTVISIFSDVSKSEIRCFAKDLKAAKETATSTRNTLVTSTYEVQDFVQIDPNNVGVVIRVEGETITVLDQTNNIRLLRQQDISQKKDSRRAVGIDSAHREIKNGDLVTVLSGPYAKRAGPILHLHRSWAFIKTDEKSENGGIFVVRTNNLSIVGAKPLASTAAGAAYSRDATPQFAAPQAAPQALMSRGRKDPLVGKHVTIAFGPFKGYKGIVKDANEITARVELHTKNRIITMERDKLITEDGNLVGYRPQRDTMGMQTPMVSQTPMYDFGGGKTPAWDSGSRTPAWDSGGKTPMYDAGGRTPAWDSGSKTPAYKTPNYGGRTPAWDSGSKTPHYGGRTPAWESGSKTPRADSDTKSSRTPALNSNRTPAWSSASRTPVWDSKTPAYVPDSSLNNQPRETFDPVSPTAVQTKDASFFERSSDWVTDGIEVEILAASHSGKSGVIKKVNKDMSCVVEIGAETIKLYGQDMKPVQPSKNDRIKCISGEYIHRSGKLIGLDGDDCIVKLDDEKSDFKITKINLWAKLK